MYSNKLHLDLIKLINDYYIKEDNQLEELLYEPDTISNYLEKTQQLNKLELLEYLLNLLNIHKSNYNGD